MGYMTSHSMWLRELSVIFIQMQEISKLYAVKFVILRNFVTLLTISKVISIAPYPLPHPKKSAYMVTHAKMSTMI